jgi:adenosylcobinamide-phosphate synthase
MRTAGTSIIFLALGLDHLFGDPPNRFHPVAWMGSLISWAQRFKPDCNPGKEFLYGAGISLGGGFLVFQIVRLLIQLTQILPLPFRYLAQAAMLKMTFSVRGLAQAAREVQSKLTDGDLNSARSLLAWHLVSRDTTNLDPSQVASATIESIAENASDGILAPLFYYALGGLPLTFFYRFTNTADSMLGYHTPFLEWLGKFPARLDDLLNYIPARLTGLSMILAAILCGEDAHRAWGGMRGEARNTLSPNAGFPMSAMAGALGVELIKVGQYRLGTGGDDPQNEDIQRATRIMIWSVVLGTTLLAVIKGCINKLEK